MDLFRDEDIAFAQRLMQAGVPTELHVNPGAYHAAEVFAPQSPLAERIWRLARTDLEQRFDAAVDLANQARYLSEGGSGPCA